jgi:7,8-dihydroneopterin aldolase/epimerase/oxygenase
MPDCVLVRALRLHCLIGVNPAERESARELRCDLVLETDCRPAGESDDLALAVDYSAVADCVHEVAASSSFRLLEALAERLATTILAKFPQVSAVRIEITKADVAPNVEAAGVRIERQRGPRGGCRERKPTDNAERARR